MSNIRYFSEADFVSASPSCSMSDMDVDFLMKLDLARRYADVPFKINSAFRTINYEISKGRKGTSSHCKGLAVDIAAPDNRTRFKIIHGLFVAGFTRIGIGSKFVHVDMDYSKNQNTIWLYGSKNSFF